MATTYFIQLSVTLQACIPGRFGLLDSFIALHLRVLWKPARSIFRTCIADQVGLYQTTWLAAGCKEGGTGL